MTKDVTVRLVELLDAIDDAVERGAPQLGGFDFSALSVAHEEIIRLRTAVEPEHKILSWLKANARKGRSTVSINVAPNGDITLDNLHVEPTRECVCPDSEDGNHVLKQDGPFSVVYCDACGMNRGWRTQEPENQNGEVS